MDAIDVARPRGSEASAQRSVPPVPARAAGSGPGGGTVRDRVLGRTLIPYPVRDLLRLGFRSVRVIDEVAFRQVVGRIVAEVKRRSRLEIEKVRSALDRAREEIRELRATVERLQALQLLEDAETVAQDALSDPPPSPATPAPEAAPLDRPPPAAALAAPPPTPEAPAGGSGDHRSDPEPAERRRDPAVRVVEFGFGRGP